MLTHECCAWQVTLKELTVDQVVVQDAVVIAPDPAVETLGTANNDEPPPSFFLQDSNWVRQIRVNCAGGLFMETEAVDNAMMARADVLGKLIRQRLANHKAKKVDASKQSHFALGWFSGNVSCVAAIVVLANHTRAEPNSVDENACLLQHPTEGVANKFMVIETDPLKAEGCCVCHDKVDHQWRRSGKVSGRGFGVRHEDHWKSAKNSGSSASTKQSPVRNVGKDTLKIWSCTVASALIVRGRSVV
jgi:hypothetical protein